MQQITVGGKGMRAGLRASLAVLGALAVGGYTLAVILLVSP
jgi:hypothetical protein